MTFKTITMTAMAALAMAVVPVQAQTTATVDGSDVPPVSSYDSRIPFAPDTRGFPQTLIGKVPDAMAQQAHARMMRMRAHASLTGTFARMRFMFDRSETYRALADDEKSAVQAYQAAREAALARLAGDEDYQAVVALRDEMGDRIAALQDLKDIRAEDLVPLAEEKLNYGRTASAMEARAIDDDAKVAEARDRFVAAGTKLAQAKRDFDDSLRYHPQVEAARANLADARVNVVTTAAYSNALRRTAKVALDYAYHIDRDRSIGGSARYGYGYGNYGYKSYRSPYVYRGFGR